MLIFQQGYRWGRWTDFNAQYLKTRVSAGSENLDRLSHSAVHSLHPWAGSLVCLELRRNDVT